MTKVTTFNQTRLSSGIMGQTGMPKPSVKIVRDFTREDVLASIHEADGIIASNFLTSRGRVRVARTFGVSSISTHLAVFAALVAIVLSLPYIVARHRPRPLIGAFTGTK